MDLKETSQLYSTCKKAGLTNFHSSTIATIMRQVEMNLDFATAAQTPAASEELVEEPKADGKKAKKTTKKTASAADASAVTVDQICDTFISQANFFENAIVREQVFQLRALQLIAKTEFDELDARKNEIETLEKSRHAWRVYGLTGFFTAQFAVGYYAIFCVPWLGWDLVEPITFTVGQGSFIMGLILIMRNRGANIEYSDLESLYCRTKRRQWLEKYDFDLKRHAFLQRKLIRIENQLKLAEE